MPIYKIQGPDGRVYKLQGPEGATNEQLTQALNAVTQSQPQQDTSMDLPQSMQVQQGKAAEQLQARQGVQQAIKGATNPYKVQAAKQSTGENLLAGIGGGLVNVYKGAKDLFGMAEPGEMQEHKDAMQGLRSTKAGMVGEALGGIAATSPLSIVPGLNTYAGATAVGAGLGALQPTTVENERLQNVALGAVTGLGGQGISSGILRMMRGEPRPRAAAGPAGAAGAGAAGRGRVAEGLGTFGDDIGGLSPAQRKILEEAKALGFKTTPGQSTGSETLTQYEKKFAAQPITSAPFYDMAANNQTIMNRAAVKAIGETGDTLDSNVINSAFDRLGKIYKTVGSDAPIQVQPDAFVNKLADIEKSVEGLLPAPLSSQPLVKGFLDSVAGGNPTGKQLRHYASQLGKAANQQMTSPSGNRELGLAMFQIKEMADDMVEGSLSGTTKKVFKDARQQYRNLMLLTDKSTNIVNPSTGDVSGRALARKLQSKDKSGFLRGQNNSDMYTAARFHQAFNPVTDVGSDTASKLPMGLVENALAYPAGLLAKGYLSAPSAAAFNRMRTGFAPGIGQAIDDLPVNATGARSAIINSLLNN